MVPPPWCLLLVPVLLWPANIMMTADADRGLLLEAALDE